MDKKDVAYVGTYTHGSSVGIHLYDVDTEGGALIERKVIPANNSSYIRRSNNGKYLYSIIDEGVAVFAIQPDGDLELIDKVGIEAWQTAISARMCPVSCRRRMTNICARWTTGSIRSRSIRSGLTKN